MWHQNFVYKSNKRKEREQEPLKMKRVLILLAPHKALVFGILFCIIISAVLGILPPYLTALLIDQGIEKHNIELLFLTFFLIVIAVLTNSFLAVIQIYLSSSVSQRIMANVREHLFNHLLDLPINFFNKMKLGDLISRFNNDINGLQSFVIGTFINVASNVVILLATIIFMFIYNWPLAIAAVVIVPTFVIPLRQVGRVGYHMSFALQEKLAEIGSFLVETLGISGILLIKSFVRQEYENERFKRSSQELMSLQVRQSMIGRWFFMFTGLFSTIGPALVYLIGGLEVVGIIPGHTTVGEMVAFAALFTRLYSPTTQLMNAWVDIQRSKALFNRIFGLLEEPGETENAPNKIILPTLAGQITFDHVCFAYENGPQVLHDVSFKGLPGQLIALVGPSGAGKTTVINLINHFYRVTEGAIRIDGYDINNVLTSSLRKQIGVVAQETYLFHASLRENIAYGHLQATDDEIILAAKAANIHEFIMSLPLNYDTIVGERGYKLSGGEKQRIAIARVILKNPRILILDEATSSLDSRSEASIQSALEPLIQKRTTIVIAHRLSTILAADIVLVMDRGHLVEYGTHCELLAQGGTYTTLYQEQFKVETERLTPK